MKDRYTIRLNFTGGIISPGDMLEIIDVLKTVQVSKVRFGLRQQMIFEISGNFAPKLKSLLNKKIQIDDDPLPNIVSSYVAEEVFQKGNWLTEGIYKDIFDQFDFDPRLKINISDAQQSFTPLFSGHINFVSSEHPNFWYLFFREPKSNKVQACNKLLFTNEIAQVVRFIEQKWAQNQDASFLQNIPAAISMPNEKPLAMPHFSLPYYEGFNRYGKKSWLGIYRRDELFNLDFLQDICQQCFNTKIGEICLTPWKSVIIKNIAEQDRKEWTALLAKHDINVRHAANELNWQVEDASPDALNLKLKLAEYFNQKDLRTFGLALGIKTLPKTEVYASILVRRRPLLGLPFVYRYDITYTKDYDPNGRDIVYFSKGIPYYLLAEQLRRCILQYSQQTTKWHKSLETPLNSPEINETRTVAKQCPECLTIYQISGTDACCYICHTASENFVLKEYDDSWIELN